MISFFFYKIEMKIEKMEKYFAFCIRSLVEKFLFHFFACFYNLKFKKNLMFKLLFPKTRAYFIIYRFSIRKLKSDEKIEF